MNAANGYNAYLNNHYEGMDPNQLILMLYDGALKHLHHARIGVMEENPQTRGEHLGKVIAIISELNASISPEYQDESTQFLRGLYNSILIELPKVSITNDIKIVDQTTRYIQRLKGIWEQDVMGRQGQTADTGISSKASPQPAPSQLSEAGYSSNGYRPPTRTTPLRRPEYGRNQLAPRFDEPSAPLKKTSIMA